jgi:hypothetical protein
MRPNIRLARNIGDREANPKCCAEELLHGQVRD